jgi:signal peptidase I
MNDEVTPMKKLIREYLPFALAILCLFAARSSLADHYVVPSGSMEHTLVPGDRVAVDKRAYGLRLPFTLTIGPTGASAARGDIVVFDSPADGTRLIKRVVAVDGDIVEIRAGHVLINGLAFVSDPRGETELFGERVALLDLSLGGGPDVAPVKVPAGHVFVLGDARGNSRDSRFFGFVRESDIYARGVAVYFRGDEGFVWRRL